MPLTVYMSIYAVVAILFTIVLSILFMKTTGKPKIKPSKSDFKAAMFISCCVTFVAFLFSFVIVDVVGPDKILVDKNNKFIKLVPSTDMYFNWQYINSLLGKNIASYKEKKLDLTSVVSPITINPKVRWKRRASKFSGKLKLMSSSCCSTKEESN